MYFLYNLSYFIKLHSSLNEFYDIGIHFIRATAYDNEILKFDRDRIFVEGRPWNIDDNFLDKALFNLYREAY